MHAPSGLYPEDIQPTGLAIIAVWVFAQQLVVRAVAALLGQGCLMMTIQTTLPLSFSRPAARITYIH